MSRLETFSLKERNILYETLQCNDCENQFDEECKKKAHNVISALDAINVPIHLNTYLQ